MFNLSGNNEERTGQMRQTAHALEMKFVEKDEYGMTALLRDFYLFSRGGSKAITNLLTHTSPLMEDKVNIFDFKYRVSTGKSSHTHEQTVFFINSKRLAMPEMLMKPEHFFHKIGAWFGMQDIDFQEHKEFSDQYLLQGGDEAHIRRTMNLKPVIRFFTIEKNWCLESIGYFLIFYQLDLLIHPGQIKHLHAKGMSLFEQFKTEEF
ncbi:MAG: hypothetical protein HY842_16460 [Bacteroidetes bacterium]|nr:hypothetical protein [Bacteroidota bacterium]